MTPRLQFAAPSPREINEAFEAGFRSALEPSRSCPFPPGPLAESWAEGLDWWEHPDIRTTREDRQAGVAKWCLYNRATNRLLAHVLRQPDGSFHVVDVASTGAVVIFDLRAALQHGASLAPRRGR